MLIYVLSICFCVTVAKVSICYGNWPSKPKILSNPLQETCQLQVRVLITHINPNPLEIGDTEDPKDI